MNNQNTRHKYFVDEFGGESQSGRWIRKLDLHRNHV